MDATRLSLNTATVRRQWSLQQAIEACARHGFGGIAPWRDMLQSCGVREAAAMIGDHGLAVTGLCRGGLFTPERSMTQAVLDDNYRAVDEAVAIGAACLVMVVGGLAPGSRDLVAARSCVEEGLARVLDYARPLGMPIAIEPLHPMYAADRACINTLAQALDLCDRLGPGVGVAADCYHIWWDPLVAQGLERAGRERLLAFHICDWLVPTRDLLNDRGMMGDGVIDIAGLGQMACASGFEGLWEIELFSERWWREDPDQLLATCVARAKDLAA